MKKTIIILIIILLIIGMTVGIYFYWKAKKNVVVTPPVKEGLIAEKIMQYPQFTSDKKWIYYYSTAEEPAFYRLELSSQKIEKISDDLADIDNIIYSPDLSHAAFKVTYDHDRFEKYASPFLDPKMQDGQTRYWIVNFKNKTLNYLNENIVNLNFTNDSQKIIYLYRALAGDSSLNLANTDGSNYETIIDWQSESVVFEAFDDNNFLMVSLADESGLNGGLYKLQIKEKKATLLTKSYYASNLYLNPSKKNILFISPTIEGQETSTIFFMTDINGQNYQEIINNKDYGFDTSKIVWSKDEKNIYLAANSKNQTAFNNLLKIDLENKTISQVKKEDSGNFSAVDINEGGDLLYYLLNAQLYAVKI